MTIHLKIENADDAMDWLTFASSIVGAIAWPIAVFAIAFLFKQQIVNLLNRIKRLSVGENSVDFGERLDEVEADVEEAGTIAVESPDLIVPDERMAKLIAISPAAAILDVMRDIERKVLDLAAPFMAGPDKRRGLNLTRSSKILMAEGQISPLTYVLLEDLRSLRNAAAHGEEEVTRADALRFISLAGTVRALLEGSDLQPDQPTQ